MSNPYKTQSEACSGLDGCNGWIPSVHVTITLCSACYALAFPSKIPSVGPPKVYAPWISGAGFNSKLGDSTGLSGPTMECSVKDGNTLNIRDGRGVVVATLRFLSDARFFLTLNGDTGSSSEEQGGDVDATCSCSLDIIMNAGCQCGGQ